MEKTYITHDFYTAVLLKLKEIPLVEVRRLDDRFVEFVFGASPAECEQLKQAYWERHPMQIALRDVIDEIKMLKSIVHEQLGR